MKIKVVHVLDAPKEAHHWLNNYINSNDVINLAVRYDVMLFERDNEIHVKLDGKGKRFRQR
jgi:hypothetical protein